MLLLHPTLIGDKTLEYTILIHKERISHRHWIATIGYPRNSPIEVATGDHIYMFPENDTILVENVLNRLSNVTAKKIQWDNNDIPISTAKTALTKYVDLNATPIPEQIAKWIEYTIDKREKNMIRLLCQKESTWQSWVSRTQTWSQWAQTKPNILDFLQLFPGLKIPAEVLICTLNKMLPRPYSVAYAGCKLLDFNGKKLLATDLVFEAVYHQTSELQSRKGTCTGFLTSIPIGHRFLTYKFPNKHFKLPDDRNVPILMIATGSGIAPFRGFWKQRFAMNETKMKLDWLYFGCRNENEALFYDEACFHVNVRIAFSRKSTIPKTYVQDLLDQDSVHIYNLIVNHRANIYICGKVGILLLE